MTTVKTLKVFKYQVNLLAKQKDATLFYCYIHGDIFRIATAKKAMDFDFTDFKSEEKIIHFMLIAIAILKKHLHKHVLLFDDMERVHEKEI
jgi:hypothetical protein